jgi:hypothetical protein
MLHRSFHVTVTILDIFHLSVFYLKLNVSGTAFCLHLQVLLAHLGPTGKARPEDIDRIQCPKSCALSKRQDDGQCPEL